MWPKVCACVEADDQPMEKFKPFELLNSPIWLKVAEGESTPGHTMHVPPQAASIKSVHLFK